MKTRLISLIALGVAAAMAGFADRALADEPMVLTDAQLDRVTAGDSGVRLDGDLDGDRDDGKAAGLNGNLNGYLNGGGSINKNKKAVRLNGNLNGYLNGNLNKAAN